MLFLDLALRVRGVEGILHPSIKVLDAIFLPSLAWAEEMLYHSLPKLPNL